MKGGELIAQFGVQEKIPYVFGQKIFEKKIEKKYQKKNKSKKKTLVFHGHPKRYYFFRVNIKVSVRG